MVTIMEQVPSTEVMAPCPWCLPRALCSSLRALVVVHPSSVFQKSASKTQLQDFPEGSIKPSEGITGKVLVKSMTL
jgi:hypothetical protein